MKLYLIVILTLLRRLLGTLFCHFPSMHQQIRALLLKIIQIDRGRVDYSKFIAVLSQELNIASRVKVVHDVYLPTLLKNAIGTITINSIAGLSFIYHETPVICLDRAMYNIEGLTAEDVDLDGVSSLDLQVNKGLYKKFRVYLVKNT